MRFSFIDAKKAELPVVRLARFSQSARAAISLGKTALQANAGVRTCQVCPRIQSQHRLGLAYVLSRRRGET